MVENPIITAICVLRLVMKLNWPERGIEAFSLRSVAKRASVSQAARPIILRRSEGLFDRACGRGVPQFLAAAQARGGEDLTRRAARQVGLGYRLCDAAPGAVPAAVGVATA
jgi:hypothetical protein